MTKQSILSLVSTGLTEAKTGNISYRVVDAIIAEIDDIWNPKPIILYSLTSMDAPVAYLEDQLMAKEKALPKRPPPWHIGLSSSFTKEVSKIDMKLRGRVMSAILEIACDPTTPRGDTIKALAGELRGCWRYRLGDYRLVYSPDQSTGDITLVTFAARGSVYLD